MSFRPALPEDELWVGEMAGVNVDGHAVLLLNVEGTVCAYEDRCPHRAWRLSQGKLIGSRLVCAAHEWEYDACSGRGINPAGAGLRRYDVEVLAGQIRVNVDPKAGDV